MEKRILRELKQRSSMSKSELARALELQSHERQAMRAALARLERQGKITLGRGRKYNLHGAANNNLLVGTLRFHPKGHSWFYPDPDLQENIDAGLDLDTYSRIFIGASSTGVALDGDKVAVQVVVSQQNDWLKPTNNRHHRGKSRQRPPRRQANDTREKMFEGRVVKILERQSPVIIGTYFQRKHFRYLQPDNRNLPRTIELSEVPKEAQTGQKVVIELLSWETRGSTPIGKITRIIGFPEDKGVDVESVIYQHGIRMDFPEEAIAELADITAHEDGTIDIAEEEIARREDWRKEMIFTIDPATAKDHDDAVGVRLLGNGHYELAVHIADVSHYVRSGSRLDEEAQRRGNSTYLVDRVIPMLPEKLSNNACSLRPDVDRLTKAAIIEFDTKGQRLKTRFCDAVINSKAKLAYEQAQCMLEGQQVEGFGSDIYTAVREVGKLAKTLRSRRFDQGALDLDFPESSIVLNDKGRATNVVEEHHNESHQMIEECMLAANEAVAVYLKGAAQGSRGRTNTIYRIHEEPDPDRLQEFSETAQALGFRTGDLTNRLHVQQLLKAVKGSANEDSIKLGLLKSLKRASYSTDPIGHYGLAKEDYCHFTSPIRRYADLIVHRSLQKLLANPPASPDRLPTLAVLSEVSAHISETERRSAEAETQSKRMKLYELLDDVLQGEDVELANDFEGIVTEVRRHAAFVEIKKLQSRGMIKAEDLYRMRKNRLEIGHLHIGDRLRLRLVNVDVERQHADYIPFDDHTTVPRQQRPKQMRRRQAAPKPQQANSKKNGKPKRKRRPKRK